MPCSPSCFLPVSPVTGKAGCFRLLGKGVPEVAAPLLPEELEILGAGTPPHADVSEQHFPPVYLCGTATSSLDVARVLAEQDLLPPWGSVLAVRQTAGRGQLRRLWLSPPGNIHAALRLPSEPPFTGTAAAPATGGLVAEALHRAGASVRMKWPNDIVTFAAPPEDPGPPVWRKIGGILIRERHGVILAGIGINLAFAPPDAALRAEHALPAGTLKDACATPPTDRPAPLWTRLAHDMFFHYTVSVYREHWRKTAERHLAFRGRTVLFAENDHAGHLRGTLEGLDETGGLRLSTSSPGESPASRVFLSGSLRLPQAGDFWG